MPNFVRIKRTPGEGKSWRGIKSETWDINLDHVISISWQWDGEGLCSARLNLNYSTNGTVELDVTEANQLYTALIEWKNDNA